ncbi:uncharacterized low-complexity proteins [Longilinea arvoryzae]|uniref:Uncharacterized low-complexity proteins n=1 Tax=Longilinea arvoryzae TaxID=360412 RepID=A0A0S7BDP9_9CHLR|nr:pentapeptide repeat-containing protein [Longilinea arvoryzae]GAP13497.1 uncharacterized low-complexity proteins [Longilinea arvoryzae]
MHGGKKINENFYHDNNQSEKIRINVVRCLMVFTIGVGGLLSIIVVIGFLEAYNILDFSNNPNLVNLLGIRSPNPRAPKTLFDLFEILIIPVLIAIGTIFFEQAFKSIESRDANERQQSALIEKYLETLETLYLDPVFFDYEKGKKSRVMIQAYTRDLLKNLHGHWIGVAIDLLDSYYLGLARDYNVNENLEFEEIPEVLSDLSPEELDKLTPIVNLKSLRFSNADLSERKFTNMNLEGVWVIKSKWDSVDCRSINFFSVRFNNSSLRKAKFINCNFSGANFSSCNLEGCLFDNCILENAIFSHANLRKVEFIETDISEAIIDSSTILDYKQAVVIYLHNSNSSNQYLVGEDLHGAYLAGVSFVGAILCKANFSKANLRFSDFRNADLRRTNFNEADLTGSDLRGANLAGADLRLAVLNDVKIDDQTILSHKWKVIIDFTNGIEQAGIQNLDFSDAMLAGMDFNGDLSGYNFRGSQLYRANFTLATLVGADFSSEICPISHDHYFDNKGLLLRSKKFWLLKKIFPNLWTFIVCQHNYFNKYYENPHDFGKYDTVLTLSDFTGANLTSTSFTNAIMTPCLLSGAIAGNSDFSKAFLQESEMSNIYLVNSNLDECELSSAWLNYATLNNASFIGARLIGAHLQFAKLQNANFTNANLSGADLSDADLSNADLSGADLSKTILIRTKLTNAIYTQPQIKNAIISDIPGVSGFESEME